MGYHLPSDRRIRAFMSRSAKSDWLDAAAVLLSGLCLLHCLALPLVVAGLPLLAQYSESHLHLQILLIVVPLSVVALALGYRRHRNANIIWAGAAGLLILFVGATVVHNNLGETADRIVTITGSLVLAAAHYFNSTRGPLQAMHGEQEG